MILSIQKINEMSAGALQLVDIPTLAARGATAGDLGDLVFDVSRLGEAWRPQNVQKII